MSSKFFMFVVLSVLVITAGFYVARELVWQIIVRLERDEEERDTDDNY